jgi:tetratricopeptide (TPR) repeat protein
VAKQVAMKLTDAKLLDAPENLLAAVDKVLADRKTNLDKITTLETDLTKATDDNKKLTTDLADAKKLGTDLQTKLTTTEKQLTDTTKQRDDLQSVVNSAAKLLFEAKVAPEKSDNAQFLAGVKEIIRFAEMKDPAATMRMLTTDLANLNRKYDSDTAQLKADKVKALADQKATHDQFVVDLKAGHTKEVNNLNTQIKESRRAAEVMPAYLKALQERGTGLEAPALEDIGRVGRDPKATPVEKASAEVIRGLVQRNRYEFTDSKESLQKGLTDLPKDSVFAVAGSKVLAEVSDPAGYVKQQVKDLQARGQGDAALKLLQTTLEALPAEARPALMAERSLLQLDELRRKTGGRFQPDNPALVAAQKDADAAEAAGTPEGSYAAGRIAEEMGQFNLAIEKYREALKRHDKMDEQGALYRVALARSLVQVSQPWTPPSGTQRKPAEPGVEGKTSRRDLPAGMREMLILLAVGIQPGELLGSPNRAEAQKLAEEILALGDKAPFNLRAQALAIKGDWTEALKVYAEGLRGSLSGELSEGLLLLIRNHPDLKSPDRINPVEAERLYGQAVRLYFQRAYADAEKLFLASLEFNNQDARAFYFLGLSRLGQGKQDLAYASFEAGAQLERQSKPGAGAINSSLERVQGPERRILSQVRDRVER